jgi:uncharacterized membrane protein SpoIIM required for sporulation
MGTPSQQQEYVENSFAEYYTPGAGFATMVWTNNAFLTAVCIATGITGFGPVYFLAKNAIGVGATGGMMAAHGHLDMFLQLIAPHGLLELTAVFVAGAAGLRIFWTWVDPGPRPRGKALAQEARALFTVAIGLVGVLAVSGLIEGFVTGSALPWAVKVGIGVVALAAFWTYTLVLGRRAVLAGHTGDLEADRAGYVLATAGCGQSGSMTTTRRSSAVVAMSSTSDSASTWSSSRCGAVGRANGRTVSVTGPRSRGSRGTSHVPATRPSSRNVAGTTPFGLARYGRCSGEMIRVRSACPSSTLS